MKSLETIVTELDNLQVELRAHIIASTDEGSERYECLEAADNYLSDTIDNIQDVIDEEEELPL